MAPRRSALPDVASSSCGTPSSLRETEHESSAQLQAACGVQSPDTRHRRSSGLGIDSVHAWPPSRMESRPFQQPAARPGQQGGFASQSQATSRVNYSTGKNFPAVVLSWRESVAISALPSVRTHHREAFVASFPALEMAGCTAKTETETDRPPRFYCEGGDLGRLRGMSSPEGPTRVCNRMTLAYVLCPCPFDGRLSEGLLA